MEDHIMSTDLQLTENSIKINIFSQGLPYKIRSVGTTNRILKLKSYQIFFGHKSP